MHLFKSPLPPFCERGGVSCVAISVISGRVPRPLARSRDMQGIGGHAALGPSYLAF